MQAYLMPFVVFRYLAFGRGAAPFFSRNVGFSVMNPQRNLTMRFSGRGQRVSGSLSALQARISPARPLSAGVRFLKDFLSMPLFKLVLSTTFRPDRSNPTCCLSNGSARYYPSKSAPRNSTISSLRRARNNAVPSPTSCCYPLSGFRRGAAPLLTRNGIRPNKHPQRNLTKRFSGRGQRVSGSLSALQARVSPARPLNAGVS